MANRSCDRDNLPAAIPSSRGNKPKGVMIKAALSEINAIFVHLTVGKVDRRFASGFNGRAG
jgi:hypothetical protein